MTARRLLLAANWKMNPLEEAEAVALARGVLPAALAHAEVVEVAVFPPYPWLPAVSGVVAGTEVGLGAQDCHWERAGAFTGEVSAAMLADRCGWIIAGHSERRIHLGETDELVARKAAAALDAGLQVIVCVGEREEQFAGGGTAEVVSAQARAAVEQVAPADAARLAVAYEPVWAIGTGRNAEPAHADGTMRLIRRVLEESLGAQASARVRLLYGGSTSAGNVASYVELPVCDGCLVGGASLRTSEFSQMIATAAAVARRAQARSQG